jgi:hypothetical protein
MLKPTEVNILRMSEAYLNQALDTFADDLVTVALIEMRLDQIAYGHSERVEKAKNAEIHRMMKMAVIQDELRVFFEQFQGSRMVLLINALEPDYISDYVICEETFLVTSLVAQHNQNHLHECDSLRSAQAKAVELAYKRVWDKYVRYADVDTLTYVKQKLVA